MFGFGGKRIKTKKGKEIILLNPTEKSRKFAAELSTGMHYTNSGDYKPDKNGEIGLTNTQKAYRAGYLDSRRDGAKVHKYYEKKGIIEKPTKVKKSRSKKV